MRGKVWLPAVRAGAGVDVYTQRLADGLTEAGVEVELSWFSSRNEFFPALLKSKQPPVGTSLIHANSWNGFAFKRDGIPLVITAHHSVSDPALSSYKSLFQKLYHHFIVTPYERKSFHACDALVTPSHYSARRLAEIFGLDCATVIHNWTDLNIFSDGKVSGGGEEFRILFIGNMSRRKGADLLPSIMKRLRGTKARLYVVAGLKGVTQEFSAPNITVIGKQSEKELVRLYQSADIMLFPSRLEGFGLAPLEAQACGVPVVATRGSSLPEVISDGESGFLCEQDNVEEFADRLLQLIDNRSLRMGMSQNARQWVERQFCPKEQVGKYVRLYRKLLGDQVSSTQ